MDNDMSWVKSIVQSFTWEDYLLLERVQEHVRKGSESAVLLPFFIPFKHRQGVGGEEKQKDIVRESDFLSPFSIHTTRMSGRCHCFECGIQRWARER
jgi:hypothetical protein